MKRIIVPLIAFFISIISSSFDSKKGSDKTLQLNPQNSQIKWIGKKFSGEHFGNVPISQGKLIIDGQKLKGGTFDIDLTKITVADITDKDGNAKLVKHLKDADFFAVEKFPKSTFVINKVKTLSPSNSEVTGTLTIKGISKEIKFPVSTAINDASVTANATITINRTDFGIKYGSKSFFDNLGDKFIYDDFVLEVSIKAKQ